MPRPLARRTARRSAERPLRMIVVEADGPLRAALLELFAERYLPAIVLTDGAAVIRHLESSITDPPCPPGFEVVIADVDAPRRSGWEILDIARARRWSVRVVLTAPAPTPALRMEASRSGAAGLLPRPRTKDEWKAVLASAGDITL